MSEQIVSKNKAVYFSYLIMDESGDVLEQSEFPIGYVHGVNSDIIEKLELGMDGKKVGDQVEVKLTPEEGFGEPDPDLIFTDNIKNVPEQFQHVGAQVEMQNDEGDVKAFVVTKIAKGKITVDGNHPLAGKNLIFNITVTEIREASADEITLGKPQDEAPPRLH